MNSGISREFWSFGQKVLGILVCSSNSIEFPQNSAKLKNYAENVLLLNCNFKHAEDLQCSAKYTSRLVVNAFCFLPSLYCCCPFIELTLHALLFIFASETKVHLFSVQLLSHSVFPYCLNRERPLLVDGLLRCLMGI